MQKRRVVSEEESLAYTLVGVPVQGTQRLRQTTRTGAWLTVQRSTINGTEMGAQEWQDSLFLRYGLETLDLPH